MKVSAGETLGPQGWDRMLLGLPGANLLQSWTWGVLQSRFGWSVERLAFDDGSSGLCSLQRCRSLLPGGALYYVPRGPAVTDRDRIGVLHELTGRAGRGSGMVLRVEPEAAGGAGNSWVDAFAKVGFRPGEPVQPRVTSVLSIDQPPDQLRASFKPKTRYNLTLAGRKGVTVSCSDDIATFARLSRETAQRHGIALPSAAYYQAAFDLFSPHDGVRLYLAHHDGSPLAGIMVFRFGRTAYYLFGGSTQRQRDLMPNYLLHWTAILEFRALGCTSYDWWGIPDPPSADHPWFGLYRFKTGFGGETVHYPGLYQRVLRPGAWRWEERLRKLKTRLRGPILG